ncbi:MAG TPA: MBL fold metallo-hydrolase [Bryobacteraceae bacterium]|nr:MBL fold metallo-hydrolase [Bryobacteraceae bacterium]
MKLRISLASIFGALLLVAFFISDGTAEPGTVKKIAEGVWFREGDLKNLGHCNNTIIEMKDYLIVVDANYPSGARLVMAEAKKLSPKPVKYVFVTHHHGDHDYGAALWTAEGATTFAYKGVVDEMKRYEPNLWRSSAKSRPDVAELKLDSPELPKQTFDTSPYVIKDSTREVRFYFFGWAHTRGDGFAWLPKERIIATGDASTNSPDNNTSDANIGNWPNVMEAALKLNPQFVLPGHGPAGGPEVLKGQAEFMRELRKAAEQAVRQGKKLDDIVTVKDGKPSATSITLPASVQTWVGPGLPKQLSDAFKEVSQGKPIGELPHN